MRQEVLNYLAYTKQPWGVLFYDLIWHQMGDLKGLKIVDFGSGLGITADHYAKNNQVLAVEPDEAMLEARDPLNVYDKHPGSLEVLNDLEEGSVDYVVCHNVFEYVEDKESILKAFERVLKPGGRLSVVKHNHLGRVMQKVVFENKVDEAMAILEGSHAQTQSFGQMAYYENEELLVNNGFSIEASYGVRTFFALQQNNEEKKKASWKENMFMMENRVSQIPQFRDLAFYHHLILVKG